MSMHQSKLSRLLDEAAIRNVTYRFADASARGDYSAFTELWSPDAVWTIGKPLEAEAHGISDIVKMMHKLRDSKTFFVHYAMQGPIEIGPDEALSRCVCYEAALGPGETYYRTQGIYHDRLSRSTDGWIYTHRRWEYLWLDTSPFSGDAFAVSSGSPVLGRS